MKKRSKYRPKPVIRDVLTYVISGFKPIAQDAAMRVKLINHGSLLALTRGEGTRTDWELVRNALNVAVVLAELECGNEYIEEIKLAMMAHAQCGKRFYKGQNFGYTGEQLNHVATSV